MVKELVKLSADKNENRFYRMEQQGNVFVVRMGRIGVESSTQQKKPMSVWDTTLRRKLKEGYVDRTDMVNAVEERKYSEIEDARVRDVIEFLVSVSRKAIEQGYTVSYEKVTPQMVEKAQEILNSIRPDMTASEVNGKLMELFVAIPRKMKRVQDYLAGADAPVREVVTREQELLDVMAAQVSIHGKAAAGTKEKPTLLDTLGVTMYPCTASEEAEIKRGMKKESSGMFARAFRVVNSDTDRRFNDYMKRHSLTDDDIHYLYHGSRNQNWIGLISEGPKLNPNAIITGKAFGNGIYFANRAKKSIGYSEGGYWVGSCRHGRAYMAVYKVAFHDPLHTEWIHSYSKQGIYPHDAVFAHAGRDLYNDEIIVFSEAQITIQYLIELQ